MPKTTDTPASVLQSLIDKYQISAFSLSKSTSLDYQTLRKIVSGKGKITVPTAIKLGKYFGQSPAYWIDIQCSSEIITLAKNKKFISEVNRIQKVQKPTGKPKIETTKRKPKILAEKRKKAAKVPRARGTKRKRTN